MSDLAIDAQGLSRDYVVHTGRWWRRTREVRPALVELNLAVTAGEAVGYLGANGAGKSTTIKLLTGILVPSRGRVRTCGFDPVPQRRTLARHIGVVFGQRSQLWWDLPLAESYPILGAMHRLPERRWRPRFDALVDELELASFLTTPVRQLSLGQRMRGEVAAALLHSPELLVLDEPTIGLDLLSKERLRSFLARERTERGTTLLLTTHDLGDVQRLCDRMVIIDRGRLAFDGTQSQLAALTGVRRRLVVELEDPAMLQPPEGAEVVETRDAGLTHEIAFDERLTAASVLQAVQSQASVRDLALTEPSMEDLVGAIYRGARA